MLTQTIFSMVNIGTIYTAVKCEHDKKLRETRMDSTDIALLMNNKLSGDVIMMTFCLLASRLPKRVIG
jgi:hypothetical protein